MNNIKDYWFTTYTGKQFHLFEPHIDEIDIEDIAHALSMICRYGGHVPQHYSVAQHSLVVSCLVPEEYALEALLHDAEETYTGDIVRPFKKHPAMSFFSVVGLNIQTVIIQKFNLFPFSIEEQCEARRIISEADNLALLTEKRDIFPSATNQEWIEGIQARNPNIKPSDKIRLVTMHHSYAKQLFLERFKRLWEDRQNDLKQKRELS